MSLYARLKGLEEPKLPVHQFGAAVSEYRKAKCTRAQILTAFVLSAEESTQFDDLFGNVIALPEAYSLGSLVDLNLTTAYDGSEGQKGLGFMAVDVGGITRVTCRVRYSKNTTGALTWQLWNETNAQQLATFDDTGPTGDKQEDVVLAPAQPLAPGIKVIRLRVKSVSSTVQATFFGASVFVERVERLTADDVHAILMLAETPMPNGLPFPTLDTEAKLK